MSTNPGYEYINAEKRYLQAASLQEKYKALQEMLRTAPKHKSSEKLVANLKTRLAKLKDQLLTEKKSRSGKSQSFSIKKEGAAQIAIVGTTNSGKSTLLSNLTNAKVEIAPYPFTTKKPEIGTLDYKGIKLQVIEIPPITKDFMFKDKGPALLAIVRQSDLIITLTNNKKEQDLVINELKEANIKLTNVIELLKDNIDAEKLKEDIWSHLNLIKVYTKTPGKERDYPPIALKKNSTIKNLAEYIHKDFVKKFKFSRVWGKSIKHQGSTASLNHVLKDEDIVELHTS